MFSCQEAAELLFFPPAKEGKDMKSDHIDNSKLYEVVNETALLEEAEIKHLTTCEECLEMIRGLIRQKLSQNSNP